MEWGDRGDVGWDATLRSGVVPFEGIGQINFRFEIAWQRSAIDGEVIEW